MPRSPLTPPRFPLGSARRLPRAAALLALTAGAVLASGAAAPAAPAAPAPEPSAAAVLAISGAHFDQLGDTDPDTSTRADVAMFLGFARADFEQRLYPYIRVTCLWPFAANVQRYDATRPAPPAFTGATVSFDCLAVYKYVTEFETTILTMVRVYAQPGAGADPGKVGVDVLSVSGVKLWWQANTRPAVVFP